MFFFVMKRLLTTAKMIFELRSGNLEPIEVVRL